MAAVTTAWECRDPLDQAEIYYNHPVRVKNKTLEEENVRLKRLLRENGISWQTQPKPSTTTATRPFSSSSRITRLSSRSSSKSPYPSLPHLPVEIQLRILSFALTSPHPIVDPLTRAKPENLLAREKAKGNHLAIHFLATCRAFHVEGIKYLWSNNSFVFTSPHTLRNFAEIDPKYRGKIKHVTFRLIAKFYDDDESRNHRIQRSHHPDIKKPIKLIVTKRPMENTLARRGFRAYAWYQLVDFLEALLPPFDPATPRSLSGATSVPRLLPSLERLRIDFVNFAEDILMYPPPQLHDLASHQLGCTLNEVVVTGLPTDECGLRVSTELSGLLKDEGLLIDHAPVMVAQRSGIRVLNCDDDKCHYSSRVVRAMKAVSEHESFGDNHPRHSGLDLPPAPPDEGEPPFSDYHFCRTIWKKVPVRLNDTEERRWELFDRVSGMPWADIEADLLMFDYDDDDEGVECENCGQIHPGAILADDLMMDIYDDM